MNFKLNVSHQTSRLLELAGADTVIFSEAFDSMLGYSLEPANLASIMNELKGGSNQYYCSLKTEQRRYWEVINH